MTSHVAKIILAKRSLRWSSPLSFNDPFDITQELRLNFSAAELNRAFVEELAAIYEGPDFDNYAPSGPIQKKLKSLMDKLRGHPDVRQRVIEAWRNASATAGQQDSLALLKEKWGEIVPRFRMLCLSELNDLTSMWNHYADGYRGVVLEFEAVDQLDSVFLIARPVTYQDTPPAIANKEAWARCLVGGGRSNYEDLFTALEYVKTMDWAYEREWRIVSFARDDEPGLFSDTRFNARELTKVYFGLRCSQDDENEILALLMQEFEHVAVYKASIVGTESKFTFKRIRASKRSGSL